VKPIGRLLRTVRHLRPTQIAYQLKYRLIPLPISRVPEPPKGFEMRNVAFDDTRTHGSNPWVGDVFRALNREQDFSSGVDWSFMGHGKLWQYNLQYFSHLPGTDASRCDVELARLCDFHRALETGKVVLEPYPVSLRLIHTIRFKNRHGLNDTELDHWIWRQGWFLRNRLEYHLLANHLLENAFALTLTGWVCNETEWFETGLTLLVDQLQEQVLTDGAHYERSAMYHHILTYRVLEFLNWSNEIVELRTRDEIVAIRDIAVRMLGWMRVMAEPDGGIPRWADMAEGIAPSSESLLKYADALGLDTEAPVVPSQSGYRVYREHPVWLSFNVGGVTPEYQPGHAHADQLSFLLFVDGTEVVTDTGISTYEADSVRQRERSTAAHNTILVADTDSAEIWGGFRVGRRPKVHIRHEEGNRIIASHNGYRHLGVKDVTRDLTVSASKIAVKDAIHGTNLPWEVQLHIHPDRSVELVDGCASIDGLILVEPGNGTLVLESYEWCVGYNLTRSATRIRIRPNGRECAWTLHIR
jgi:hypothetical protein